MKIIDLRSDTVTHPTEEMRRAMYESRVGDDIYGEDPTVNALEQLAAQMMKREGGTNYIREAEPLFDSPGRLRGANAPLFNLFPLSLKERGTEGVR